MAEKKTSGRKILSAAAVMLLLLLVLSGCGSKPEAVRQTEEPTAAPTTVPTAEPTAAPTTVPTAEPTAAPTTVPTAEPTAAPVPVQEANSGQTLVTGTGFELTFSGELSELIFYEENPETEQTDLVFYVRLKQGDQKIFTLMLDSEEGDIVSMIDNASGQKIPIAFDMGEIPINLNPKQEDIFCRAQESVNEIIASIVLK